MDSFFQTAKSQHAKSWNSRSELLMQNILLIHLYNQPSIQRSASIFHGYVNLSCVSIFATSAKCTQWASLCGSSVAESVSVGNESNKSCCITWKCSLEIYGVYFDLMGCKDRTVNSRKGAASATVQGAPSSSPGGVASSSCISPVPQELYRLLCFGCTTRRHLEI